MPLDIALFRDFSGGNSEAIRESQRRRFASVELVDEIISVDAQWRQLTGDIDNMKRDRNVIQKEVGKKKKAGEPCDEMVAEIKAIGDRIVQTEEQQANIRIQLDKMINKVGNIVDSSVPVSKDEDADNAVVRKWGTPRDPAGLLNHHDLLWRIGGYEPERGVGVAGHRAYFLRDVGVLLNQAFIAYGTNFLRSRGYCMLQPPYFMKKEVMAGVAQLEQFDEELYKVGGDGEDKYLIATSEQPICGYHMNEWMDEKSLPLRYGGISTCFRKEAGSHGKDTWGIFRVHQFEKVEQFVLCEGDLEKSQALQEEMIATAEEFYQSLGFPYHVINIVSGALNNAAIKKLDLECWFPGYNAYRELVSCSNCTDYQSRAMEIRCGNKKLGEREKKYVHMLNATLCATGRAICCLLETYQEPNGVRIPDVLVPYMNGVTFLPFVRDSKLPEGKVPSAPAPAPVKEAAPATLSKQKAAEVTPPAPPSDRPQELSVPSHLQGRGAELYSAIHAKGEELRVLKASKGSKEDIKALVDQLLALKVEYKEATGEDYVAPGAASAPPAASVKEKKVEPKEGENKKKEKKEDKKPAVAAPAAAPKESVVAVSNVPASTTAVHTAYVPRPIVRSGPLTEGTTVSLFALETRLAVFPYLTGYAVSREDARIFDSLGGVTVDAAVHPQSARWYRQIASYSTTDRAAW